MRLSAIRFRRTTLILVGCIAFLAGLGIVGVGVRLDITWVILLAILLSIVWFRKNLVTLLCIVAIGLALGIVRGEQFYVQSDEYNKLYGKSVVLVGSAKSDGLYDDKSQLSFDLGDITVTEPDEHELIGKVTVAGYGADSITRGDIIKVSGKLYPTRGSKQARMSFAELEVVQQTNSPVESFRQHFVAGMYSSVPDPEASFGLGLLIGQRTTLPDNIANILKIVGLTHIVAVSGYNLTILVRAAQRMFGKRSKYQAVLASSILITGFLAITGLSASIVRASIVSALGLTAWYFGRRFRPTLLIALAAALTAGWYPIYLWSDIGWYLSFLAFFGVLVLAPLLTKRVFHREEIGGIKQIVIESFCAQIMTAPLIIYIFHLTSVIGLVANVLIVPLVPLAMLLSAIAGIAGILVPSLAGWFAWPATYLLTYMLDLANIMSEVPHAQIQTTLTIGGMVLLYALIIFVTTILYKRSRSVIIKQTEEI